MKYSHLRMLILPSNFNDDKGVFTLFTQSLLKLRGAKSTDRGRECRTQGDALLFVNNNTY